MVGKPFPKGVSPNPGGRTKEQREREKSLSEAIRGLTGPNCELLVERLVKIALVGEHKDSNVAIKTLLERSHGKAPDVIQLEGETLDPRMVALVEAARMTPHERRKALAELDAEPDGEDADDPDET